MSARREKVEALIDRLIRSTESRRIKWNSSLRDDTFVSLLEHGGFEIARRYDSDPEGEGIPVEWYEFSILAPSGVTVERFSSNTGLSGWDTEEVAVAPLAKLFSLARSQAHDADSLLDELMRELPA